MLASIILPVALLTAISHSFPHSLRDKSERSKIFINSLSSKMLRMEPGLEDRNLVERLEMREISSAQMLARSIHAESAQKLALLLLHPFYTSGCVSEVPRGTLIWRNHRLYSLHQHPPSIGINSRCWNFGSYTFSRSRLFAICRKGSKKSYSCKYYCSH